MVDKTALIIYDISDDKRRRKVVKILESYGIRIQESAFECSVTDSSVKTICRLLKKQLDEDEDKLRIYILNSQNKIHSLGNHPVLPTESFYFV